MGRTRKESGHASRDGSRWPPRGGSVWVTPPGSVWATPSGSASPTPVAHYRVAADSLDALNAKVLQSPAAEVLGRDRRAGTQAGYTARAGHTGSWQPSGTEGRAQRGGVSERRTTGPR